MNPKELARHIVRMYETHELQDAMTEAFNEMERKTRAAYRDGLIDGMVTYAWWKDGTQYVGTTGTTLADAVARVKREMPL